MPIDHDANIATTFAQKAKTAREHLWREMEAAGMTPQAGWRVGEFVRPVQGGSELVMRPKHQYLQAPQDMECVVWIDGGAASVEMECIP